jgi:hypothetical protein
MIHLVSRISRWCANCATITIHATAAATACCTRCNQPATPPAGGHQHCPACEVAWAGPTNCWICGQPGQPGPTPNPPPWAAVR